MIEGVGKAGSAGRVRESESGKIGSNNMDMRCQQGNQVAEHVRRRGKAMQQQDGRRSWRPCFAVKDVESIHIAPPVADRYIMNGHGELLWLCCRNHRLQGG